MRRLFLFSVFVFFLTSQNANATDANVLFGQCQQTDAGTYNFGFPIRVINEAGGETTRSFYVSIGRPDGLGNLRECRTQRDSLARLTQISSNRILHVCFERMVGGNSIYSIGRVLLNPVQPSIVDVGPADETTYDRFDTCLEEAQRRTTGP